MEIFYDSKKLLFFDEKYSDNYSGELRFKSSKVIFSFTF